jgi:aminomethyltransferase
MLRGHVPDAVLDLGYYRFATGTLFGADAVLARTGYTGEDGFELYFHPRHAAAVWEGLMAAGKGVGLEPVGLGARDTLRLEMGFMLYGNDIDDTTSPLEAGLGWTVKLAKRDFVGRDTLVRQKEAGVTRRLVGFTLEGRRVARPGSAIESGGRAVGKVTSGSWSPSLSRPIGLAYVETPAAKSGALDAVIGDSRPSTQVVKPPFYTKGSRKSG